MDYKDNNNVNNNNGQRVVYTYDPKDIQPKRKPGGKGGLKKALMIFAIIVVIVIVAGILINKTSLFGSQSNSDLYQYDHNYIGVLKLHGTIGEDSDEYNQQWMLERIKQMKNDENNKGLILSLNTPGGSVYESDELYLAIKDYQTTNKPVYSYMESMAASGGYYISAPCDKIIANRNCWTGSIGVTIGTIYDISGLLEKAGIKTVTITSGKNKAMGSMVKPLTKEQKEIYQGLVDEAYEQFVEIVADGRDMKIKKVKKIADGRVYTAEQARRLNLVDAVESFDDAVDDMKKDCNLQECSVENLEYDAPFNWKSILSMVTDAEKSKAEGEYDGLMKLMDENNKFTITYMSEVSK